MWEQLPPLVPLTCHDSRPVAVFVCEQRGLFDVASDATRTTTTAAAAARVTPTHDKDKDNNDSNKDNNSHAAAHTRNDGTTMARTDVTATASGTALQPSSLPPAAVPLLRAFVSNADAYIAYKHRCTEQYLAAVERAVDRYLAQRYNTHKHKSSSDSGSNGKPSNARDAAVDQLARAGAHLLHVSHRLLRVAATSEEHEQQSRRDALHGVLTRTSSSNDASAAMTHEQEQQTTAAAGGGNSADNTTTTTTTCASLWSPPYSYTADVIPEHYLDQCPSAAALERIRDNYVLLLHALRHTLPHSDSSSNTDNDSRTSDKDVYDAREHAHLRAQLLTPTIESVWRRHLAPLQSRAQELLNIATRELPSWALHTAEDDSATHTECSHDKSRSGRRCDGHDDGDVTTTTTSSNAAVTTMTTTTSANEAAAMASLRARVVRCVAALSSDVAYMRVIRDMDAAFVEHDAVTQASSSNSNTASSRSRVLNDHVPVYGLVLSRLHRLEMEHRTVLELWGGGKDAKKACSSSDGACA